MVINFLIDQLICFSVQSAISRLLIKILEQGWYITSDGYIYKLTTGRQSWEKSRQLCQEWGGDLAVHGVKALKSRRYYRANVNAF